MFITSHRNPDHVITSPCYPDHVHNISLSSGSCSSQVLVIRILFIICPCHPDHVHQILSSSGSCSFIFPFHPDHRNPDHYKPRNCNHLYLFLPNFPAEVPGSNPASSTMILMRCMNRKEREPYVPLRQKNDL